MKRKDLNELKNKEMNALKKVVEEKKKEYSLEFSKIRMGKEKNTSFLKSIRKDIAQIKSVLREKEIISKLEGENK